MIATEAKYVELCKYTCCLCRVRWHRGVAVERLTRDREVAGSGLGRALRCKNSGQVSHTYG